jgi:[ribosomal protein S5]-alanine N-acetyltransferase
MIGGMSAHPLTVSTDRLRLEPLASRHVDAYARLIAHPDVHRYLSRAVEIAADPDGQARRIVALSETQWATRGLGPFAIYETAADAFVGRGGLFWIEALQAVEINYMFDPSVWGRGYATEVAAAFLRIGFEGHGLERMVATTNPANEASARVLRKVGLRDAGFKDLGDHRIAAFHEITRAQWLERRPA